MTEIRCSQCQTPYPDQGVPFRCPICQDVFDVPRLPAFDLSEIELDQPGIWRFRAFLGLPASAPMVTLGEGNTPIVWAKLFGREVGFKLEFLNPTGSFKDRGTAVLVSFLLARGVQAAVEDSSGNAGSSFAAYCARVGMKAQVFVPEYASGPKRKQIEAYGARVVAIPGERSRASEAAMQAVAEGAVYGSHAYMPQGLFGFATIAYELYQEMGEVPGVVVVPAGQGSLLLGIGRGFLALKEARLIHQVPRLVGVQAQACAPLWALFQYGIEGMKQVQEGNTLAEGVRIRQPLRSKAILKLVAQSEGTMVAVAEEDILPGRDQLARMGLYVEPTSAIIWKALEQIALWGEGAIVVVLTGSGLKSAV